MNTSLPTQQLRKQKGVAIITAILVIALGTIALVSITSSQQMDMQRERNEGLIQMARALGNSGERFASALLYRDFEAEDREGSDSLEDDWAQPIPPVPIDNASIQGCIVDMQGHFNLNNLINEEGVAQGPYIRQLRSLLRQLSIDETKADAIVDWIDADINYTDPDGAEDDYYTSLETSYRTANAPFVSVSELQLVKGFSSAIEEEAEDYALLLPHIAALPTVDGPTAVNVNTATPEVIGSLSDDIQLIATDLSTWDTGVYEDYPDCEDIFDLEAEEVEVSENDITHYEKIDDFNDRADLQSDTSAENATNTNTSQAASTDTDGNETASERPEVDIGVTSNYFQVRIDVEAEGIRLTQYTLLQRDDEGRTRVVYRSRDAL